MLKTLTHKPNRDDRVGTKLLQAVRDVGLLVTEL